MRAGRRPAGLAAVLSLQLAAALRSAGRAGQPRPADDGVDFASPDVLLAELPPEKPEMTSLARRLGADFEKNFGHRVDKAFGHLTAPAVMTVSGYMERVFLNFLLNLQLAAETNGTQINVVNAVLDPVTLSTCRNMVNESRIQRLKVQCVDLVGMLPDDGGKGKPHSGSFLWAKPVVLRRAVLASSHGVLLADVDVIFYKDLLLWTTRRWQQEQDVVLTVGTEFESCCNTGTVYADRSRSMPLLDLWLENNHRWFHRRLGDQDALLHLVMFNVSKLLGIANSFKPPFPPTLVDNGEEHNLTSRITLFSHTQVIEQAHKCRGCPCRGPCANGEGPYAKHYNCINMHMQQEHTLRARGNWSEDVDRFSQTQSDGRMQMMAEEGDWRELEQLEGEAAAGDPAAGPGATSRSARGGVFVRRAQRAGD